MDHETIDIRVFVVVDVDMSLNNIMSETHNVILCLKCSAATHELTYRRNANYKDEPINVLVFVVLDVGTGL